MADDMNICKMLNKNIQKENFNNEGYFETKNNNVFGIIAIINGIAEVVFLLIFCIHIYRYVNNINNYMFIFLGINILLIISLIIFIFLSIKRRK